MKVIFDGKIQSCCNECGRDTRHAIEMVSANSEITIRIALCGQHMLALSSAIDQAFVENTTSLKQQCPFVVNTDDPDSAFDACRNCCESEGHTGPHRDGYTGNEWKHKTWYIK